MATVKQTFFFNVLLGFMFIVVGPELKSPFIFYTLAGVVVVLNAMKIAGIYREEKDSREREEKLNKYIDDTENAKRDSGRKEDSEWVQCERNHKFFIVYFDDFIKRSKYQDLDLPEGIDPAKGLPIAHIPKKLDITEMLALKDEPGIVTGMLVRIDNEEENKFLFDWGHSCEHFGTMAWIRPFDERSYREFWENYRNDNNAVVVGSKG